MGVTKGDTRSLDYGSYGVTRALIYLQDYLVVPITG